MEAESPDLRARLRSTLRHRVRPMSGHDPSDRRRTTTPLELFFDLTYVIAFAAAAEQLAHSVGEGHVSSAIGAYVFAVFAVSWSWMNFTWFASAYGNDDAVFRIATIVQMIGAVILVFGLPMSFSAAAEGHSPNNMLMVIGYIIMRVPLIGLWLRAAREDPRHRQVAVAYAITIAAAQLGWILTAVLDLPLPIAVAALLVLAVAELTAPVLIERRFGNAPWNAGHIAERFSLLTLITLGEVIAATTSAVGVLTEDRGWSLAAVVIASSGLVLAAGFWWAYFQIPSREILERWPERTFAWRYAHLPIFGAVAAVGAGLRVAAGGLEEENLSVLQICLAMVIPVGAVILMIFVTWSVLMRSYDLTHVPLFLLTLLPLGAAVVVAVTMGSTGPLDLNDPEQMTALLIVFASAASCAVIEVIGHEIVGFRHTVRVVERGDQRVLERR